LILRTPFDIVAEGFVTAFGCGQSANTRSLHSDKEAELHKVNRRAHETKVKAVFWPEDLLREDFPKAMVIVSWFTGILQLLRDHLARSFSRSRIPFF